MGRKILSTSDSYNWYGLPDLPNEVDICLVRFKDGGLSLVYGSVVSELDEVAMWAVVEPMMHFIRPSGVHEDT